MLENSVKCLLQAWSSLIEACVRVNKEIFCDESRNVFFTFVFINNPGFSIFAEIVLHTLDPNVNVVIIDYESSDINIEAALRKSSLQRYTVVRIPAEETFQRAKALQRGAEAVNDPHSILFLCDLHLKIPAKLISTIRKVRIPLKFAPKTRVQQSIDVAMTSSSSVLL